MIGIESFPKCGFGNRILYYYNLRNEAWAQGCRYFCVPWQGYELFEGPLLGEYPEAAGGYEKFPFCLGERFFADSRIVTREVFKLKDKLTVPPKSCAIHFRGSDFHSWNPESILDPQYYLHSIEEVAREVDQFILFTDDPSLESYNRCLDFLAGNHINTALGQNIGDRSFFANDFAVMTQCDVIISSPSSYNICAGFIGKKKKIIHSGKWVAGRVGVRDKFWVELHNGGNDDYKVWKFI